jgi:hypothetical protein
MANSVMRPDWPFRRPTHSSLRRLLLLTMLDSVQRGRRRQILVRKEDEQGKESTPDRTLPIHDDPVALESESRTLSRHTKSANSFSLVTLLVELPVKLPRHVWVDYQGYDCSDTISWLRLSKSVDIKERMDTAAA